MLVTGSRWWRSVDIIRDHLRKLPKDTVLIHGTCKGADDKADKVATSLGMKTFGYPADWKKFGKSAGVLRNQQMLDEEHVESEPIDLCLAFHENIEKSRGTKDMIKRCETAGIPVILVTDSVGKE